MRLRDARLAQLVIFILVLHGSKTGVATRYSTQGFMTMLYPELLPLAECATKRTTALADMEMFVNCRSEFSTYPCYFGNLRLCRAF